MKLLENKVSLGKPLWGGLEKFIDNLILSVGLIEPTAPILLSGDWGSGKSSVLIELKERLEKGSGRVKVIFFEAWRFEKEPNLLTCLIREIWKNRDKNYKQDNLEESLKLALRASLVIGARSLPVVTSLLPGGGYISDVLKNLTVDKAKKEWKDANFDEEPEDNPTAALKKQFFKLLTGCFDQNYDEVFIMIDDLDRCSPESAIDLLESLRLILTDICGSDDEKNTGLKHRFLIAMDKVTLSETVANKFSKLNSYDSNRYLEKIFPYVFSIPTIKPEEVSTFIHDLIDSLSKYQQLAATDSSTQNLTQPDIGVISNCLNFSSFRNPRLIIRCINKFILCQYLLDKEDLNQFDSMQKQIIVWIAATERWPMLKRLIATKPYKFWLDVGDKINSNDAELDVDMELLTAQSAFKEFYNSYLGNTLSTSLKIFSDCEQIMNKHGL